MKKQIAIITLSAVAAMFMVTGCEQKSESPSTAGGESAPESKGVAESVKEAAKPVVEEATKAYEAAKPAVEQAAKDVKEAATTAMSDATAKANSMIDQAKKLISETKYSEAKDIVSQLTSMKLTPEQEKLVADLKAQIDKAIAALSNTNAASAIGNLLNK